MKRALFSLPVSAGSISLIIAAALFMGAAVAYAKPPGLKERLPRQEASASDRFQQGVEAYDRGESAEAYRIWLPLAQKGDLAAMRNVAMQLRKGDGVARDSARALWFYEEAARKGHPLAQLNAGFMHLNGDGIPIDETRAAFWFRTAAMGGHPVGAYNLAAMLERGQGIKRDMKEAQDWYAKAAALGDLEAARRIEALKEAKDAPLPPPALQAQAPSAAPQAPARTTLPIPGMGSGTLNPDWGVPVGSQDDGQNGDD